MEIQTIIITIIISLLVGLMMGGLFFILKMKLAERKSKKQLKSGKGVIENITPKKDE